MVTVLKCHAYALVEVTSLDQLEVGIFRAYHALLKVSVNAVEAHVNVVTAPDDPDEL